MEKKTPRKKVVKKITAKREKAQKFLPTIIVNDSALDELKDHEVDSIHAFLRNIGLSNLVKETIDPHSEYLINETRNDYERLKKMLAEYLDSYILIGYRADGRNIAMRAIRNDRDDNALERLLQGLVMGKYKFNGQ